MLNKAPAVDAVKMIDSRAIAEVVCESEQVKFEQSDNEQTKGEVPGQFSQHISLIPVKPLMQGG